MIAGLAEALCALTQPGEKIWLGGGCMINRILSEGLAESCAQKNRAPLLARKLPPNDGALSLGQAALARAVLMNASTPSLSQ